MARNIQLSSELEELNYLNAKYNFILQHFPDCKLQKVFSGFISKKPTYLSKLVNSNYTNISFKEGYNTLSVIPYCELYFTYNGEDEKIIVHSSPKRSLLARVAIKLDKASAGFSSGYPGAHHKRQTKKVLKFARLAINLKNNNFDDKMMNECRVAIMDFIKKNQGCELDDKYLEPRLKQLLMFI